MWCLLILVLWMGIWWMTHSEWDILMWNFHLNFSRLKELISARRPFQNFYGFSFVKQGRVTKSLTLHALRNFWMTLKGTFRFHKTDLWGRPSAISWDKVSLGAILFVDGFKAIILRSPCTRRHNTILLKWLLLNQTRFFPSSFFHQR